MPGWPRVAVQGALHSLPSEQRPEEQEKEVPAGEAHSRNQGRVQRD